MASDYTEHYGLSLWEPGDAFTRAEFNENHEKLDTALTAVRAEAREGAAEASGEAARAQDAADRALEGLVPVSYDVLQLLLQRDYERKETGWKRALLFDGLMDGSKMASKDPALVFCSRGLSLAKTGTAATLENGSNPVFSTYSALAAAPVTAPGNCELHRLYCVRRAKTETYAGDHGITFTFTVDGVVHHRESHTLRFDTTSASGYISLTTPVPLAAGQEVAFSCAGLGDYVQFAVCSGVSKVYAKYVLRPLAAERAVLSSLPLPLPACGSARGWVRHSGGGAALSVRDGAGFLHPMEADGQRTVADVRGYRSTESAFRLDEGLGAGNLSVVLETWTEEGDMFISDYGVVFL